MAEKMESLSAELVVGKKFLALAVTAFAHKQYEDAGVLFAQACESVSANEKHTQQLVNSLLEQTGQVVDSQQPITKENMQQLAGDELDESEEADFEDDEDDDDAFGDDADKTSSESSGTEFRLRRKQTSLSRIGTILASAMEATAGEIDLPAEYGEDEDEDAIYEADPDIPGAAEVPVSFSAENVVIKSVTKTPIRLKG